MKEVESLERCFTCSKKFECQDAVTGKYDPCDKWTNKYIKPIEPKVS